MFSLKPFFRARLFKVALASFVALALYIVGLHATDNFHEVLPNELYRSGQLEEGELAAYTKKYGMKSVLNLRGNNTGSPWYDIETREAKSLGLLHIDFRMSAKRGLTSGQAADLVQIMKLAPKPILIHCQGGSDRTGLASALYISSVASDIKTMPDEQLSIFYGHLPSFGNDQMCKTFDAIKSSLNQQRS